MPALRALPLALGLAALGLATDRHAAATVAISFTPNATATPDSAADDNYINGTNTSSYVLGWSFGVNSPIQVTQLGWDYYPDYVAANGTPAPDTTHAVGLYDSLGVQLASATVSYGGSPGGPVSFYYAPVSTPAVLLPGQTYTIAGVTGQYDPFFLSVEDTTQPNNVGLVVDPALTYKQDQVVVGSSLVDPTGTDATMNPSPDPAYFGPNFQFTSAASAAPEPSQVGVLALLGVALGSLLLRARRRAAR